MLPSDNQKAVALKNYKQQREMHKLNSTKGLDSDREARTSALEKKLSRLKNFGAPPSVVYKPKLHKTLGTPRGSTDPLIELTSLTKTLLDVGCFAKSLQRKSDTSAPKPASRSGTTELGRSILFPLAGASGGVLRPGTQEFANAAQKKALVDKLSGQATQSFTF